MDRVLRRLGIPALTLALLMALFALSSAEAAKKPPVRSTKTTKVAPGITLTRIVDRSIPLRTFVLTVDPLAPATVDVTLAAKQLPGRATLSSIVSRVKAIAGINGDFSNPSADRPVHAFVRNGELVQTAQQPGATFAIGPDATTFTVGHPRQAVSITQVATGLSWTIDRWNEGPPAVGEIAAFSPVGGTLERPPAFSCSVRLTPTGDPLPAADGGPGYERTYAVEQPTCADTALGTNGGLVLSAPPATDEATKLLSLTPGSGVTVRWSLGLPLTYDAVGGSTLLVSDGQAIGSCTGSLCPRYPRSGIGVTSDGRVLMVVVDGRQPKYSIGVALVRFARILRNLGAVRAINLDGGGASTMVVKGEVVNRPSDGQQRGVTSAVVAYARAAPAPTPSPSPSPTASPTP